MAWMQFSIYLLDLMWVMGHRSNVGMMYVASVRP